MEIKDMTELAMKQNNVEAVMAMMKSNIYAATSALSGQEGDKFLQRQAKNTQGFSIVQMFFMVRTVAPEHTRKLMKNLAKKVILQTSLKMVGRGLQKGLKRKRVPYFPGMSEFDMDLTLQNAINNINTQYITYRDIIGIQRIQMKKNIVLILDTSGSMYGMALLNAALTTSVLSYVMNKHNYSVILFNERALFLKHLNNETPIQKIIDDILDAEAVGFTNIEVALKKGLDELKNAKGSQKDRFGILVTDGMYLRGVHPSKVAIKYPKLHVIGIPHEWDQTDGLKVCRETAKAGKGSYYPVSSFHAIPRTLLNILHKI